MVATLVAIAPADPSTVGQRIPPNLAAWSADARSPRVSGSRPQQPASARQTLQPRFGRGLVPGSLAIALLGGTDDATATGDQQPAERATAREQPATEPAGSPGDESSPAEAAVDVRTRRRIELPGLTRLDPDADVWVDPKLRRVVLAGQVSLREGPLEMFACLEGTKEHESILAVRTKAYLVHAALLAVGARPGAPVGFQPEYSAATGTEVAIHLFWTDQTGRRRHARAQDWIRNVRTEAALDTNWVFAGSSFWEVPDGSQRFYRAEEGDLICVANFPSALLDLPVESSQAAESLLYEAWTDRIPPLGTQVLAVLLPKLEAAPPAAPAHRNDADAP